MSKVEDSELKLATHSAEVERSLALVASVWESDATLTVDQMCEHLDAIGDIVDGISNFEHFVTSTNLTGRERLN